VSFDVAAEAYDRFMGRYSVLLSPQLADLAGIRPPQRAIDVGCGSGALTRELVERLGPESVAAVDPSVSFVEAVIARYPGVDVHHASAEDLPFDDGAFDAALAQLVVHFMPDPVGGLTEMARVTRPGGVVAACVWDHAGGMGPLGLFWQTARELDPDVVDESLLPGTSKGDLGRLFLEAGLSAVSETTFTADLEHPDFEEWWTPFAEGVGPAGSYVAGLSPDAQAALRDRLRERLPDGPFVVPAKAWAARGVTG
jgi:SAM-dependent methyltransferase